MLEKHFLPTVKEKEINRTISDVHIFSRIWLHEEAWLL